MLDWYYYGVWLWNGVSWEPSGSFGPQQMDPSYAWSLADSDFARRAAPPHAWGALWRWSGWGWERLQTFQTY